MIIKLTLSLPEHNTLIEGYHELFSETVLYEIGWDCPALPGVGDFIHGELINPVLAGKVNNRDYLPPKWHVTDKLWRSADGMVFPVLAAVGRFD